MISNALCRSSCLLLALALPLAFVVSPGCVSYDAETGDVIPRGKQRYPFKEVKERAKSLKVGIGKMEALLMLGAPAETTDGGDTWIYLPERKAYVVPSKLLKLEFEGGILKKHGYSAIVLGQDL